MKIATFNINGINGRIASLTRWLAASEPDVVCLQELKAAPDAFPEAAVRDAGYGVIWLGQKAWNGVAILVRGAEPIEIRRGLPGDDSDVQSRYLEAACHGVVVASLYLPNGNPQPGPKFDYKLAWMERLIAHAAGLLAAEVPAVLAGDYNVVQSDDVVDIYSARSWKKDALLQPEPRAAFRRLIDQGWTDSIAAIHPGEAIYTYWDYFRDRWPRNAGLRIDHLLLSPTLRERLVDANVDREVRGWEKPSDHAPTWVQIRDAD